MRDRATLFLAELQGQEKAKPEARPWNLAPRNLEASLQAYLASANTDQPFNLVRVSDLPYSLPCDHHSVLSAVSKAVSPSGRGEALAKKKAESWRQ